MPSSTLDRSSVADLVAKYGSSSATAWLEFERYKLWRPSDPIPESEFTPVQGYMEKDQYLFAWGNPLVSSPEALKPTALAFIKCAEDQSKLPVWCCVNHSFEEVLASEPFDWSTVSCIYEDVVEPGQLIDLTSDEAKGQEGVGTVKDLKKNLGRAERAGVHIVEVKGGEKNWKEEDKRAVETGIEEWKANKSGVQIASTTMQPWIDSEHRRYWISRDGKDGQITGLLILTPIRHGDGDAWQIKNAVSFPSAAKGTSEALIYHALKDLHQEQQEKQTNGNGTTTSEHPQNRVIVTFGITASSNLDPIHNLGGWRINALSKTYKQVAKGAGLVGRGDFRSKFASEPDTMYVCYPQDQFGLEGVQTLLKVLRK